MLDASAPRFLFVPPADGHRIREDPSDESVAAFLRNCERCRRNGVGRVRRAQMSNIQTKSCSRNASERTLFANARRLREAAASSSGRDNGSLPEASLPPRELRVSGYSFPERLARSRQLLFYGRGSHDGTNPPIQQDCRLGVTPPLSDYHQVAPATRPSTYPTHNRSGDRGAGAVLLVDCSRRLACRREFRSGVSPFRERQPLRAITLLRYGHRWPTNPPIQHLRFRYAVPVTPPLSITTKSLPNATVNVQYSQKLQATGGAGAYSWSVLPGGSLPPGITLNVDTLSGTPTVPGNYSFTVQVSDGTNPPVQQALSIAVVTPPLSITTKSLPNATLNAQYSQTLKGSGGAGAYSWSILPGGSLPPGITLSVDTLSGTPTVLGQYDFTVQLSDGTNPPVQQALSITVARAAACRSQPQPCRTQPSEHSIRRP